MEGNDEFCCTIPIFGANFESCNIFPAEMWFFRLFHTPEPAFPALSHAYGGVRDVARFQKLPKIGIVQHLRDTETYRSGRKHASIARKRAQGPATYALS